MGYYGNQMEWSNATPFRVYAVEKSDYQSIDQEHQGRLLKHFLSQKNKILTV